MGRSPCCEKQGLKRGRWTSEEDDILTKYIHANGEGSWKSLPKNADLKRGKFSTHEDETIIKLHFSQGNRWRLIASHLPGRTDNDIKNYWNSHLSRQTYNYPKLMKKLKQQVVVDQDHPVKPGSNDIAPPPRVGRKSKSVIKKNKSKSPNPNPTQEKVAEKSKEITTSSQEVDDGEGSIVIMPSTPAVEENVTSSVLSETMDDIFMDYDFSDMAFDGLEVGPTEVFSLQTSGQLGDQNGDILFTNDEVENWLMGEDITVQSKSDLFDISSNVANGAPPSSYPNNELHAMGWFDWDNLDFDTEVQGDNLLDSEDGKMMLSWLCEITSDKDDDDGNCISPELQSESENDKQNAWLDGCILESIDITKRI
ncbi:hypothetical protein AgCh_038944 [Apium graveolens]